MMVAGIVRTVSDIFTAYMVISADELKTIGKTDVMRRGGSNDSDAGLGEQGRDRSREQ